jgi:microcystin-dependent protein
MAQPYVGEIRMFGGNFAPAGWVFCNGQLLSVVEYDALFSLIGTTYGGDGLATFGVPDLRGRIPIHQDQGNGLSPRPIAQAGGVENVTLTVPQIPAHTHTANCSAGAGNQGGPINNLWAAASTLTPYSPDASALQPMNAFAIQSDGGSQPHENRMPYLAVAFILSLYGIYPSPN